MPAPAQVTLPSDREVRVVRQFNASRQLVYDAHTKSELLPKWLGYDSWDMPVRDMDVRVGGKYKWQWKSREDGKQFGFFGTFTEVNAPARLAHDQYFDPGDIGGSMPAGDPCFVSLDLQEANGVTTLVCTMKFASKEARDGAVSTGMTDGMEFSYTRLDDMFAKQAA
ncbi:SRPBCC domain-containing protein [Terricaulis silvestris]|uniref:Activator of Hsp90 ATPase n=1 Tax=Terricaulis silvestris TaxID=2686094 RepID=A0A6I6MPQ3_9CAUL|nr:SRPBCC domain-containing protein [Terricaulis silvestris]QGZ94844.1 Activator of Hsp90 ATPase [Terricaulis silvestris]